MNGNRSDNRIANLRIADDAQNAQNIGAPQGNGTSGYRGVTLHRGKWRALITVAGKRHNLGAFDTAEQAHHAYIEAKRTLHPWWSGRL